MKTVVSLANIGAPDQHRKLEAATDDLVRYLKERFPESQGFVYKVEERLANWAWPRGTKMSERELLRSIEPETRKRAFRRGIRVTRGLRWGLTLDIQTTDREMSGLRFTGHRESPLAVALAFSGFAAGILAAVGYGYQIDAYKDDYRNLAIAFLIGLAIGAVLALMGWLLSRPLERLKPEEAQEIFDSSVERMKRTMASAT